MEEFYTSFALLTAGVSLALGTVSLLIALKRTDRTDLLFGLMGLSLTVFFLLAPVGFILDDSPPYPTSLLIKRIFIYAYYAIVPWFILAYTGYPRKKLAYFTTFVVILCYLVMWLTTAERPKPVWSMIALVGFGGILMQGVMAATWQFQNGEKKSSWWLMAAMTVYGTLFILTGINQLTDSSLARALNMKLFFPIHMHALFFMLIMGLRLADGLIEKYKLESILRSRELRWKSFMINAPVIVMELDLEGRIININNFGVKLLGYTDPSELTRVDWFSSFMRPSDMTVLKNLFKQILTEELFLPSVKNTIQNKNGEEFLINWVTFTAQDSAGKIESVMYIGTDVTSEESAQNLVNKLQLELEKEKIMVNESYSLAATGDIIGNSKALQYTIIKAQQVAPTHTPVLLEGETGVGKELFANLIHKNSLRSERPFIKVNCSALPKELIEDELFGHEKGAFTSAIQSRKGRFELADGGTIFLDEIGELPLDMQPKLLRVLQNGEFERVGGQKTIKVDVRIIAATNRDLASEVKHGRFRSDLFYRLEVFPITIPALRNRKEDLSELIHYFIGRKCQEHNKVLNQISKANMQRLINYSWPGNIRELKNVIERSVIASEGQTLTLDWWRGQEEVPDNTNRHTLEQIEKDHILVVMEKCNWKINGENGAAEVLAMHPNTLRSKMKKLGITRPHVRDSNHPVADISTSDSES